MANDNLIANVSGRDILRFFIYGLALVFISGVPNNWGVLFILARGILALLLFASFVMPIRPAVLLLFMLAIAGQDIVSFGDLTEYSTASIWQMRFGPINPSWIIFGCLFWQLLKIWKIKVVPPLVKRAILWFATVPIVTGLFYGGFFSDHAGLEVVQDIRFAVMLIASVILFLSIFKRDPRYLSIVLAAFAGVLLARHLMDLIYLIANVGPAITAGVSRGSTDSAKGGVVFLLFFGVILTWSQRRLLLGIAVAIPSALLLLAYGTRNLWVTVMLGTVVLLLLLDLRRSVLFLSITIVMTIGGGWALFMANPESAEIIYLRAKTITQGRPLERFQVQVEYNLISRIDPARYAQFFNVLDSLGRRYAYLWGTGYGGYYEDSVVYFPIDLTSTFIQHSLDSGRFYKTHSFSSLILLKHGFIGLLIISALWLVPGYALFKIFRKRKRFAADQPRMLHGTMLCITAFLPTAMLQTYWSGKGLFINGMIIASCMEFARHYPGGAPKRKKRRFELPNGMVMQKPNRKLLENTAKQTSSREKVLQTPIGLLCRLIQMFNHRSNN